METAKLLVCISILVGGAHVPRGTSDSSHYYLAPTMSKLGVELEILDPTEVQNFLEYNYCYTNGNNWIDEVRERWWHLREAPRISEAMRLPSKEFALRMWKWNRDYQKELQAKWLLYTQHRGLISLALAENERLCLFWDNIWYAQWEQRGVPYRRHAMKEARRLIGSRAWYSGDWPPAIPVWRVPFIP